MPDFLDPNDFLARSSILRNVGITRVAFDPANPAHCKSLKKFLETGSWGAVMFYPEYPYTDVPTYVLAKFASHHLKAKRKTSAEASLELATKRAAAAVGKAEAAVVGKAELEVAEE